jgi:DNA-binding PadR family transcriptional regulator
MPTVTPLGEFEVMVLLGVLHLGRGANGSAVREEIEQRTGRRVARGAAYVTLDRLEEKGYLSSRLDGASPSRGGRPKRLFQVTPIGVKAARSSLGALARMQAGLEPILGDR